MRHDMPKVIIDLPRGGSYFPNRKTRLRLMGKEVNAWSAEELEDHDSGPTKFPMNPGNKYEDWGNRKMSSDRLGPLRRFLRSRVGRPWKKVHSEMSRELDNRSLMRGHHFWLHVNMEVKTKCYVGEDGKIYSSTGWGRKSEVEGLFVHPVTQILCYRK